MIPKRTDIHILSSAFEGLPIDGRVLLAFATIAGLYLAFAVLLRPFWGRRQEEPEWMDTVIRPAYAIAVRSERVLLAVFLIAFVSGLANGLLRYPIPAVNDEFGYLLNADTYASGRMVNPPHEMWQHFETIGTNQQPAYVSKYPPAPSLFLAFGQVVFGHPWWGQLIAFALAATAVAWMLRIWVGARWGLVGGMVVALHPNMQHFHGYDYGWANYSWSHSYWGGAVAMLGAALVFGSMRHFSRRPRARYGVLMAMGLALLANSRPMEGLLVSLPAAAFLLLRVAKGRIAVRDFLLCAALPLVAVMTPVALVMAANNFAATGDPLVLAHQHYGEQYGVAAELLIQEPRTPPESYRNSEMRRFYLDWVRPTFEARSTSIEAYLESRVIALEKLVWYFFSTMWPALLVLPMLWGVAWWRFALGVAAISLVLLLVIFDFHPHYAAPAAPLFIALAIGGMSQLAKLSGGRSTLGRALVVVMLGATLGSRAFMLPADQLLEEAPTNDWPRMRAFVVDQLTKLPERDLVIVSTDEEHLKFQNWVHNGADLVNGEVLFARDLGIPLSENPVVHHYADRKLWHLVLKSDFWSFQVIPRMELVSGP